MHITPVVTLDDIRHIANTPTKEASEQAELYGISDVATRLVDNINRSHEYGCFRDDNTGIATAVFGIRHQAHYDNLFLVITEACQEDYRGFSRKAREWLSERLRPVRCVLPTQSKQTLRMVLKWGFSEVSGIRHKDFECKTMEYRPKGTPNA